MSCALYEGGSRPQIQLTPLRPKKSGMSLRLSQVATQKQDLRLNAQLLHSLRLLKLQREELEQYIELEATTNDFLVVTRKEEAWAWALPRKQQSLVHRASYMRAAEPSEVRAIELTANRENLSTHLKSQLPEMEYAGDEADQRRLVEWLIESLDERGYLADPLDELAESFETDEDDLEEALLTLQDQASPAGVGARTAEECLEIQARRFRDDEDTEHDAATMRLVDLVQNYVRITRSNTIELKGSAAEVAQALSVDEDVLRRMLDLARRFDLSPGLAFADDNPIIPDFRVIERVPGEFDVEPIDSIGIETRAPDEDASMDKRSRERLNHARSILTAWERRRQTELAVARSVVRAQQAFFRDGPKGMRPLTQREIADEIGMHESTVSRVVTGRYLRTPDDQLAELREFFSRALPLNQGGETSSFAVKVLIREMVEENPGNVRLSDNAIAERLQKEHGVQIARRTVAKYRASLDIESSTRRNKDTQA